jgi:hypothetical protein
MDRRVAWPGSDSGWWLVAVGVAFTAAELLFVSPRMGLSWDEAVYVSQVSGHAPAAWFDPARARGVPLLVAPVATLTSSVAALRVYLSVLCGLGLTVALWTWRRLRPAWVLGLAGVMFGGLWVAQYYGPQAMPDMWSALGGLAAVGCFLRDGKARASWGSRIGLGASVAFVTLVRPGDAVYLAVPLVLAALLVWRSWPLAAAVVAGLLAGGAEWVAEAYARFGGIASRLHAAGAEQGGFGLHFALPDELRALNGPTLCRPCTIGVRYPELDLWWFLLPVLVALAVLAARRAGGPDLRTVLLPAVCGLCVAAQYLFMINYAAPRFLLPAYSLLAVPAADGLAFLITGMGRELRPAMIAAVTCFLVVQLLAQHLVLDHETGGTVTFHDDYTRIATALAARGVRPPCLIEGVQYIPIAFYAGCASAGTAVPGEHVALLIQAGRRPPTYARSWSVYRITGTTVLKVNAYIR